VKRIYRTAPTVFEEIIFPEFPFFFIQTGEKTRPIYLPTAFDLIESGARGVTLTHFSNYTIGIKLKTKLCHNQTSLAIHKEGSMLSQELILNFFREKVRVFHQFQLQGISEVYS